MPEVSAAAAAVTALVCVGIDVALLAWAPRNIAVTFVQLLFSATVIGAGSLTEDAASAAVVLGIGGATKLVLAATHRGASPTLSALARSDAGPPAVGFYVMIAALIGGCYASLVVGGGLGWFESGELRLDYMAGNSIALRAVRHVTPIMLVWGLVILKQLAVDAADAARGRDRLLVGGLMFLQLCAYALLEGSKGAAVVVVVTTAGAAQFLGHRLPKRLLITVGGIAVLLLAFFLSKVADEWSTSVAEAFALRMVSGSEGLLRAVAPPAGTDCSLETFWFPIANFLAKAAGHPQVAGYNSMGHCLTGMPPDYGWELLVPLLAGAYHAAPWSVIPFAIGFGGLATGSLALTRWTAAAAGIPGLAYAATYFVFFQLLVVMTDGKLANFVVSPLASTLAFVLFSGTLNRILMRASREVPPAAAGGPDT
jgi:hypothetical protein